jgi:hypothetical protein
VPEVTVENAMWLDPDVYVVNTAGQVIPGSYVPPMDGIGPLDETDAERLRLEVDEPREKCAIENSSEIVQRENGV